MAPLNVLPIMLSMSMAALSHVWKHCDTSSGLTRRRNLLAERVGFEPTWQGLPTNPLSRRVLSAAQPPLRMVGTRTEQVYGKRPQMQRKGVDGRLLLRSRRSPLLAGQAVQDVDGVLAALLGLVHRKIGEQEKVLRV